MSDLTAEQLTAVLWRHKVLEHNLLERNSVVKIEKGKHFAASVGEVCRLHLHYASASESNRPQSLICKSMDAALFAIHGETEGYFYAQIAPLMPAIPTVNCYGILRPTAGKVHILLEDLSTDYSLGSPPFPVSQLEALTDLLITLHARWWQHPLLDNPHFLIPDQSVCRMPQVLNESDVHTKLANARQATAQFVNQFEKELLPEEKQLLDQLVQKWGELISQRIADRRAITLIHGDFHLLGNLFFAKDPSTTPAVKIIDWAQIKRGIGVHDLMYMLLAADSEDRVERDLKLLTRYHGGLIDSGITDYSWQQCLWDYQFSMLTNVFQSIFQQSLRWFHKTFEVIKVWESADLLQ